MRHGDSSILTKGESGMAISEQKLRTLRVRKDYMKYLKNLLENYENLGAIERKPFVFAKR